MRTGIMPRTHGANKSILFAQILDPYEVTLSEFAQIKHQLFAQIRTEVLHTDLKFLLNKINLFGPCVRATEANGFIIDLYD